MIAKLKNIVRVRRIDVSEGMSREVFVLLRDANLYHSDYLRPAGAEVYRHPLHDDLLPPWVRPPGWRHGGNGGGRAA